MIIILLFLEFQNKLDLSRSPSYESNEFQFVEKILKINRHSPHSNDMKMRIGIISNINICLIAVVQNCML